MIHLFKNIGASFVVAFLIYTLLEKLESQYVYKFLENNLINLLVTILAINSATLSIVLVKIRELTDKSSSSDSFKATRIEMLFSIKEQIALIFISLFLLATISSKKIVSLQLVILNDSMNVALIACFVYAMIILFDIAKSVFVILDYNSKD